MITKHNTRMRVKRHHVIVLNLRVAPAHVHSHQQKSLVEWVDFCCSFSLALHLTPNKSMACRSSKLERKKNPDESTKTWLSAESFVLKPKRIHSLRLVAIGMFLLYTLVHSILLDFFFTYLVCVDNMQYGHEKGKNATVVKKAKKKYEGKEGTQIFTE